MSKTAVLQVFFRQDGIRYGDAPIDVQCLVQDVYAPVRFGMIEVVALVLEYCGGAQYCEAMGKAPWNEKLAAILRCQFHHHMLPEGAAPVTDVHCHIKYCALHHPHKLALRIRHALVVQATHHPI